VAGRPEILFPLFAGIETLPGVGPRVAEHLEALDITRPRDLLLTLPHSSIDRRLRPGIRGASIPGVVTVEVPIGAHSAAAHPGSAPPGCRYMTPRPNSSWSSSTPAPSIC